MNRSQNRQRVTLAVSRFWIFSKAFPLGDQDVMNAVFRKRPGWLAVAPPEFNVCRDGDAAHLQAPEALAVMRQPDAVVVGDGGVVDVQQRAHRRRRQRERRRGQHQQQERVVEPRHGVDDPLGHRP